MPMNNQRNSPRPIKMKSKMLRNSLLTAFVLLAGIRIHLRLPLSTAQGALPTASEQSASIEDLAKINPIDVHAHVFKEDAAFNDLLNRLSLRILVICVIDDRDPFFKDFETQRQTVLKLMRSSAGRIAFCTTIS